MENKKSSDLWRKKTYRLVKNLLSAITFYQPKLILIIPESTRFGNHLYFYLHIWKERSRGINAYISHNENMEYWFQFFPQLKEFVIHKNEIKKLDRKIKNSSFYQNYNIDFTATELKLFIDKYLSLEKHKIQDCDFDLVINVRRGDFYISEHVGMYGFNQREYIKTALLKVDFRSIKNVVVVSDDITWCKTNLSFIREYVKEFTFQKNEPIINFLTLARGKKIILANSTFSYWAAYINENSSDNTEIIAPNFHAHHVQKGKPIQATPMWELIDVT